MQLLKEKRVRGVLVNGTSGEGMLLTAAERMAVTEAWQRSCTEHGITMMVQIGGAPFPDVVQLAEHAAKINADAVLCLPELYFKPKSIEALVAYLKAVASHCPTIPFFYYHIPMFTDVNGEPCRRRLSVGQLNAITYRTFSPHFSTHASVLGFG